MDAADYIREAMRVCTQLQRSMDAGLEATLTVDEWIATLKSFDGRCAYCQWRPLEAMDHLIPHALGGGTTADNCVPVCKSCNSQKLDRLMISMSHSLSRDARVAIVREALKHENVPAFTKRGGFSLPGRAKQTHYSERLGRDFADGDELTREEVAGVLSENSGRPVAPSYVTDLVRERIFHPRYLSPRKLLYQYSEVRSYFVSTRGPGRREHTLPSDNALRQRRFRARRSAHLPVFPKLGERGAS